MSIYNVKGKGYRYDFMTRGERYTGAWFKTKLEAKQAEAERRKEVTAEQEKEQKTLTAFSGIARIYLDYAEKRYAKKTYEYKSMVLARFMGFLSSSGYGDMGVETITPQLMHEYLNGRPSAHNYNVHRKELCAFFSHCIKQLRILGHSPCWGLDKLPEEAKRKQIPTQEEFLRILAASGPNERPLLIILTHTLARIDEILRLTWDDVNFERKTVALWTRKRKGGNLEPRIIPMNDDLYKTLVPMWKSREQDQWVFWNKKEKNRYNRRPKLMGSLCRRAGVDRYGFHAVRHFMATYLHDVQKIPTGVIGDILGHKSKRTTEVYLHSVDEAARAAMTKLEGIFDVSHMIFSHQENQGS
jgi:integrase